MVHCRATQARIESYHSYRNDHTLMTVDVVVALVDKLTLSDILPAVHTHGLGHVARVLSVERGDLQSQLKRMGVPAEGAPDLIFDATTLLVLSAAARSPAAAGLLLRAGASTVWTVTRHGDWEVFDDTVTLVSPIPPVLAPPSQAIPGLHDAPPADSTASDPASP